MLTDIQIAQQAKMKPIVAVAERLGIPETAGALRANKAKIALD